MTLNFPSSPTNGQTYSLANGATYTWDGEKWKASNIPDSAGAAFTSTVTQAVQAVSALNIDCSTGNYFTKTINANSTFTVSNVPSSGTAYSFTLFQENLE